MRTQPTRLQTEMLEELAMLQTWTLCRQGYDPTAIASRLELDPALVVEWVAFWQTRRRVKRRPYPPTLQKLSDAQLEELPLHLLPGPQACGLPGKIWTRALIAQRIEQLYGVVYAPNQVSRLLRRLRALLFSPLIPESKA